MGQKPLVFDAGPPRVFSVGIVSGAGASEIHAAVRLGLDALLTGEPAEHAMADAREGGVHFIAAGHYATETFGIRRLGELVARAIRRAARVHRYPEPRMRSRSSRTFGRLLVDTSGRSDKTPSLLSDSDIGVCKWQTT